MEARRKNWYLWYAHSWEQRKVRRLGNRFVLLAPLVANVFSMIAGSTSLQHIGVQGSRQALPIATDPNPFPSRRRTRLVL
jgi:hypothetical protein